MRKIAVRLIALYKRYASPAIDARCGRIPTCSAYAAEAVEEYGLAIGALKALARILRCNPFSAGGYDPVRPNYRGRAKWTL